MMIAKYFISVAVLCINNITIDAFSYHSLSSSSRASTNKYYYYYYYYNDIPALVAEPPPVTPRLFQVPLAGGSLLKDVSKQNLKHPRSLSSSSLYSLRDNSNTRSSQSIMAKNYSHKQSTSTPFSSSRSDRSSRQQKKEHDDAFQTKIGGNLQLSKRMIVSFVVLTMTMFVGEPSLVQQEQRNIFSGVAPPPPALAFENKISNQYDDRPKRRGPQPKDLGVSVRKDIVGEEYKGLKPCGSSPNCFCSTDNELDDPEHSIPSWKYPKDLTLAGAFQQLKDAIEKYEPGQGNIDGGGFKIMTADLEKGYIYVQFESLKNGYIDDVEFASILPSSSDGGSNSGQMNDVQVRSSSRIGYLDFGVNAKRINYIANMMRNMGWDAPGVEYEKHKGYFLENQVS